MLSMLCPGKYSCEVVADKTFLTLIKDAHMQVVGQIWRRGGKGGGAFDLAILVLKLLVDSN